jgi:hypothetical protein
MKMKMSPSLSSPKVSGMKSESGVCFQASLRSVDRACGDVVSVGIVRLMEVWMHNTIF